VLGEAAQRIASIEVVPVARKVLEHELRTVGRIEFNERKVAYLTSRSAGRVERVYADFTGTHVDQGDHLVEIYAPDLFVAQQEFLLAQRASSAAAASSALSTELAREKLALLGVTEDQILELERTGKPATVLTVFAPIGGTVIEKNVRAQMYVEAGDPLYTIADLSTVWLHAEVYEYELPWVALGQPVEATLEALPGEVFRGSVAFVEPIVSEATRTVRVRVELENPELLLKPGMFASIVLHAPLGPDGKRAEVALRGRFACPMHPDVVSDEALVCWICGMALIERESTGGGPGHLIAIPVSALLDSGERRIVYVEREPGRYEAVEVVLGPRAGDEYPVLSGLEEGDRVVARGAFLIDSQAQIEGRPSLFFPRGLAGVSRPHAGHEDGPER
jgi:Cu(I)/Ag(I) efflux system membrane fusion protein